MHEEPAKHPRARHEQNDANVEPLASVLMLAYNHEPYIAEAIESVLAQRTDFPYELLIGEDCSNDRTKEIALEYQRLNPGTIRVISGERNVGMLANVRRLEEAFRGRYVAFCEADDYWHVTSKLQRQVEFLENHSDYVLVHSDYRQHFVRSGLKTPWTQGAISQTDDADAYNDMLRGLRRIMTVTACVRGSVLREVVRDAPECYDTRFMMGDTQRWFEIAHRGAVKYIPKPLATRRVLPESVTKSRDPAKVLRFHLNAKEVVDHYAGKYSACPKAAARAKGRLALAVVNYAYAAGDIAAFERMLDEASRCGLPISTAIKIKRLVLHREKLRLVLSPALFLLKFYERLVKYLMECLRTRVLHGSLELGSSRSGIYKRFKRLGGSIVVVREPSVFPESSDGPRGPSTGCPPASGP